jgi:hypothetical protein
MKDDMKDMKWMKMSWLQRQLKIDVLMSISFSVFGMLLIFGLGFVFPSINPYVVIKWIIIVAGVVFLFSFIKYVVYYVMKMRMKMMMKGEWKEKKSSRK